MRRILIYFLLIIIITSCVSCANNSKKTSTQTNTKTEDLQAKADNIDKNSTSAAVIQPQGNEATSSASILTMSPLTENQALKIANEACSKNQFSSLAWIWN